MYAHTHRLEYNVQSHGGVDVIAVASSAGKEWLHLEIIIECGGFYPHFIH